MINREGLGDEVKIIIEKEITESEIYGLGNLSKVLDPDKWIISVEIHSRTAGTVPGRLFWWNSPER